MFIINRYGIINGIFYSEIVSEKDFKQKDFKNNDVSVFINNVFPFKEENILKNLNKDIPVFIKGNIEYCFIINIEKLYIEEKVFFKINFLKKINFVLLNNLYQNTVVLNENNLIDKIFEKERTIEDSEIEELEKKHEQQKEDLFNQFFKEEDKLTDNDVESFFNKGKTEEFKENEWKDNSNLSQNSNNTYIEKNFNSNNKVVENNYYPKNQFSNTNNTEIPFNKFDKFVLAEASEELKLPEEIIKELIEDLVFQLKSEIHILKNELKRNNLDFSKLLSIVIKEKNNTNNLKIHTLSQVFEIFEHNLKKNNTNKEFYIELTKDLDYYYDTLSDYIKHHGEVIEIRTSSLNSITVPLNKFEAFSFKKISEELELEVEEIVDLMSGYIEQLSKEMITIERELNKQTLDFEALENIIHKTKGTSVNLRIVSLGSLFSCFNKKIKDRDSNISEYRVLLEDIKYYFSELKQYIINFNNKSSENLKEDIIISEEHYETIKDYLNDFFLEIEEMNDFLRVNLNNNYLDSCLSFVEELKESVENLSLNFLIEDFDSLIDCLKNEEKEKSLEILNKINIKIKSLKGKIK